MRLGTNRRPRRCAGLARYQRGRARPHYKWIALSNTTLGVLMATINQSIVLIALPDIFRGIGLNPLSPGNTSYLLWMFMGFLVVSAVLVVSFGRLGDMFGRVRMYNMGFAIFSVASIFLAVTWMHGSSAALWLIIWRVVQGIGGAFLFANSAAILTDAFPANQRGTALGMNADRGNRGLVHRVAARRSAWPDQLASRVPSLGADRGVRHRVGVLHAAGHRDAA